MANTYRSGHRAALLAGAAAVLSLLTACGGGGGGGGNSATSPSTLPGTAAPATSGVTSATPSVPPSAGPTTSTPAHTPSPTASPAAGSRCHTSELEAVLGRNDPGAGQENFPVILTNTSSRTCTIHGYPGAAFVDAAGKQLGRDPERSPGTPPTVRLAPGQNVWSGITFANPKISGARAAVPDALLVTPPDERDPLKVSWSAGEVPVSGNESTVFLTAFDQGPGS
ncbi:hypothetical protein DI272_05975 [Streptomyces sp. Act143]|uniref:DUF4232 domain-containing protein n=1 Tax=Streptomyces sp. Act143 TaxID=2200760 RepID=UPI000D681380|nr:DUF4232 domain-containing protein [Streptomyces sp. Act143]PWI13742.1 hypothetical protein DI272_05975 [Streptomyces sp. Act143]